MTADEHHRLLVDQYSYRGPTAATWHGLDAFLDTDAYLNLGYATSATSYLLGTAQHRLAVEVGTILANSGIGDGDSVLDVGCGRGGPTIHLAQTLRAKTIGVDLVPFNVRLARLNAADTPAAASFVVGDAAHLPIATAAVDAGVAIDSLVYVADHRPVYAELARVLRPGGVAVVTDLVRRPDASISPRAMERFSDAWAIPHVPTRAETVVAAREVGFVVDAVADMRQQSLAVIEPWADRYLALVDGAFGPLVKRVMARAGVDPTDATEQIAAARAVLPDLSHVMYRLRVPD